MIDPVTLMDKSYNYRVTLWAVVAILVTFFIWAASTEINQQVHATGRIIPSGKVRSIQHLEGGIVNDINIKEGQRVSANDVLFTITNKRAEADRGEIAISQDYLLIKKKRLEAEMAGENVFVVSPEIETKYGDIVSAENKVFNARVQEFNERISGLQERYKQKILKLTELGTTIKNLKQESHVAEQQLAIKAKLRSTGAISQSQYLEADSNVKNFTTLVQRTEADIPITKAELAEIQNLIEETRKSRQSKVGQELNEVNLDIKKQEQRATASQDQVDRTVIYSPVKGIINKVYVNAKGSVMAPGSILVDILPIDDTLVVEGRISTNDRGKIWLGLPVVAKITAYDYSIYGGVNGKLTRISADSFMDNKDNEFYQIRATLDTDRLEGEKILYPGMTVNLNILTGKVSVLHSILRPLLDIKDNAIREM